MHFHLIWCGISGIGDDSVNLGCVVAPATRLARAATRDLDLNRGPADRRWREAAVLCESRSRDDQYRSGAETPVSVSASGESGPAGAEQYIVK